MNTGLMLGKMTGNLLPRIALCMCDGLIYVTTITVLFSFGLFLTNLKKIYIDFCPRWDDRRDDRLFRFDAGGLYV